MALKYNKPRSSGKRTYVRVNYKKHLTAKKPLKALTSGSHNVSGRNFQGKITIRHHGGGHKQKLREIDFKRDKDNVTGTIKTIEYDPNRSSFISLVAYQDGAKKYILTPNDVKVGQKIVSGKKVEVKVGNCMEIQNIPEGTFIHNVELNKGHGGQLIRSAGTAAQVLGHDETNKFMLIKLASGEVRKISNECRATIGFVSNSEHNVINLGKAGINRHLGVRPTVRGSAMNPNDHPHGGGEGRQPIGKDAPRTPWGKRHMGVKTRNKRRYSNKMIVRNRKVK